MVETMLIAAGSFIVGFLWAAHSVGKVFGQAIRKELNTGRIDLATARRLLDME